MINVFLGVYFDLFWQSLRFTFPPSKQSLFFVYGVLLIVEGGDNQARYLCFWSFYKHYRGDP